jgi:hypothetical protein
MERELDSIVANPTGHFEGTSFDQLFARFASVDHTKISPSSASYARIRCPTVEVDEEGQY